MEGAAREALAWLLCVAAIAMLIVADVLMVLCLGGCVAFWYVRRSHAGPVTAARPVLSTTDAVRLIDDHKVMALAAALLTGFAARSDRK